MKFDKYRERQAFAEFIGIALMISGFISLVIGTELDSNKLFFFGCISIIIGRILMGMMVDLSNKLEWKERRIKEIAKWR